MQNYKLTLEYDGTDFAGWQRLENKRTVQDRIEAALKKVTGTEIEIIGSGRTDAGVHAKGQVANFKTAFASTPQSLLNALNAALPHDVKATAIEAVPENFHARFNATSRTYRYVITQTSSALLHRYAAFYPQTLNAQTLNACAGLFIGKHDFGSFAKVKSEAKSKLSTVTASHWHKKKNLLVYEITADRFLYGMVRLLVGTMLEAGAGRLSVEEFKTILDAKNVKLAKVAAKPEGLFLWHVSYK
jgi:tRNA pseudouridine38-40 synthase